MSEGNQNRQIEDCTELHPRVPAKLNWKLEKNGLIIILVAIERAEPSNAVRPAHQIHKDAEDERQNLNADNGEQDEEKPINEAEALRSFDRIHDGNAASYKITDCRMARPRFHHRSSSVAYRRKCMRCSEVQRALPSCDLGNLGCSLLTKKVTDASVRSF